MQRRIIIVMALWVLMFGAVPVAFSTPVPVENASFEKAFEKDIYLSGYNTWKNGDIAEWDYTGNSDWGIWAPASQYVMNVPDGNYIGYLSGGSITQMLDWYIAADNKITLTLEIGNRSDKAFPTYSVDLLAGGTVLNSIGNVMPGEGLFATLTLSYLIDESNPFIGSEMGVRVSYLSGYDAQLNFDNLQITNNYQGRSPEPVPEPATMLLLGSGLAGLAGYGRKKFKK